MTESRPDPRVVALCDVPMEDLRDALDMNPDLRRRLAAILKPPEARSSHSDVPRQEPHTHTPTIDAFGKAYHATERFDHDGYWSHHHDADTGEPIWWDRIPARSSHSDVSADLRATLPADAVARLLDYWWANGTDVLEQTNLRPLADVVIRDLRAALAAPSAGAKTSHGHVHDGTFCQVCVNAGASSQPDPAALLRSIREKVEGLPAVGARDHISRDAVAAILDRAILDQAVDAPESEETGIDRAYFVKTNVSPDR